MGKFTFKNSDFRYYFWLYQSNDIKICEEHNIQGERTWSFTFVSCSKLVFHKLLKMFEMISVEILGNLKIM